MYEEANDELEQIDAFCRALPEVLKVRLMIYKALNKFELLDVVATKLWMHDPSDSDAVYAKAVATRVLHSLERAIQMLGEAITKAEQPAPIHYLLAVYKVEMGNIEGSKVHLKDAFALDSSTRVRALDDPDLAAIWNSLDI